MPKKLKFSRAFLSLAITVLLTEITTSLWTLPSQAASIAFSQISTELTNFSHTPDTTQTFTDTTTLAIALTDSSSSSIAQAEANFFVEPTLTSSQILSSATGEGSDYFSSAQSEAQIIGDFTIDAGEIFSFDFLAAVNSLTLIDNLSSPESASASGELSFLLVDTLDPSLVYDSFLLSFSSDLPISNNSLTFQTSDNFLLANNTLSSSSEPAKNVSSSLLQGSLNHQFENATNITLIQDKSIQGSVAVPEPEALLGSIFFISLIGIKYRNKKKTNCLHQKNCK
jgi:hypothetical protein